MDTPNKTNPGKVQPSNEPQPLQLSPLFRTKRVIVSRTEWAVIFVAGGKPYTCPNHIYIMDKNLFIEVWKNKTDLSYEEESGLCRMSLSGSRMNVCLSVMFVRVLSDCLFFACLYFVFVFILASGVVKLSEKQVHKRKQSCPQLAAPTSATAHENVRPKENLFKHNGFAVYIHE